MCSPESPRWMITVTDIARIVARGLPPDSGSNGPISCPLVSLTRPYARHNVQQPQAQREIEMSETAATAPELKRGLVVTKDTIQVPGKKRVLDLPSVGYEVSFSVRDVRELQPEHFKVFVEEFRKHFNE